MMIHDVVVHEISYEMLRVSHIEIDRWKISFESKKHIASY